MHPPELMPIPHHCKNKQKQYSTVTVFIECRLKIIQKAPMGAFFIIFDLH